MAAIPSELNPPLPSPAGADELARTGQRSRQLVLALVAAFLLLGFLPIEGAVIATGEVSLDSRVKVITHDTGGVLARVLVREGQRVKAGQPLLEFDRSVLGPAARNASRSRAELLALRARLEAERDGRTTIAFPAELASNRDPEAISAMASEERQFTLGRSERTSNEALLRQQMRQSEAQIDSYRAQIDATRRQIALIQPELEGLRSLRERGLVTVNRLNQMERTAVELTASLASLEADTDRARAQIAQINEQIINANQSRRSRAGADLTSTAAQLTELDTRSVSVQANLDRAVVIAPNAGVIDQLFYTTVGSFIPPDRPVVRLVPQGGRLSIDARVRPADVDALRVGQVARVRFSSLERELSPEITGRVAFIAAQRTDDPELGASYYRLRVDVDQRDLAAAAAGDALRSGQPAEVYLATGSRSILVYLFKPLLDQMRKAVRE